MLVLRLELWPKGNRKKARELAQCRIENTGWPYQELGRGNYLARFYGMKPTSPNPKAEGAQLLAYNTGPLDDVDRDDRELQAAVELKAFEKGHGAWALIFEVLRRSLGR